MNSDTIRSVTLTVLLMVSIVGFAGPAGAATSTEATLLPSSNNITPGETVTYEVKLAQVDNGVKSYSLDASVNNTKIATITGIELVGTSTDSTGADVSIAADGSNVSLSAASGSHENGVIARINVTAHSNGVVNLNLSNVVVGDNEFTSYTITATNDAAATVGVTTDIAVQSKTIRPNKTSTVRISLSDPSNGIGSYEFTASVGNASVATISSVELIGADQNDTGTDVSVAGDGSNVSLAAASGDHSDGVIAKLKVTGHALGTTTISLSDIVIGDQNNTEYLLSSVSSGNIRVQKAPPSPTGGDDSPTDTDGDGTYEDVTGDRQVNVLDVGALLLNRNSESVQENVDAYDYNGDGQVNILDIGKLLRAALEN